jgi:hypothetical protein
MEVFKVFYKGILTRLHRCVVWSNIMVYLVKMIFRIKPERSIWILEYFEVILGGYESHRCRLPVCNNKKPLPWYTYPAIEYIEQYDFSESEIFEYGSGNSSKFWSSRAKRVTSVEFDPEWYQRGLNDKTSVQSLMLRINKKDYVNAIHHYDKYYDVIVIDGKFRYSCALESIIRIKEKGLIILDNSDWYPNTAKLLRDNGFIQVDFIGTGPINSYAWCTSLFFKENFAIPRINNSVKVLGGISQISEGDY